MSVWRDNRLLRVPGGQAGVLVLVCFLFVSSPNDGSHASDVRANMVPLMQRSSGLPPRPCKSLSSKLIRCCSISHSGLPSGLPRRQSPARLSSQECGWIAADSPYAQPIRLDLLEELHEWLRLIKYSLNQLTALGDFSPRREKGIASVQQGTQDLRPYALDATIGLPMRCSREQSAADLRRYPLSSLLPAFYQLCRLCGMLCQPDSGIQSVSDRHLLRFGGVSLGLLQSSSSEQQHRRRHVAAHLTI